MKERCPDSKLLVKAVLKDYKIAFTIFSPKRECGCADIIPSEGDEVWGLLYEISEQDLKSLDKAEAHPYKYCRLSVIVEDKLGNQYQSETYRVVTKNTDFLKPSKHYLGIMQGAAQEFNFPEAYKLILAQVETSD